MMRGREIITTALLAVGVASCAPLSPAGAGENRQLPSPETPVPLSSVGPVLYDLTFCQDANLDGACGPEDRPLSHLRFQVYAGTGVYLGLTATDEHGNLTFRSGPDAQIYPAPIHRMECEVRGVAGEYTDTLIQLDIALDCVTSV